MTASSLALLVAGTAMATAAMAGQDAGKPWATPMDADARVASVEGLAGPEAVRYDPGQDVYFVSNFNGDAAGDANGFVSRVSPEGEIEALRYMRGTDEHPMHGPRGMFILGDLLWVADADGLHGFERHTGRHEAFVDFTVHEPGFLNDIAAGPGGVLYVTDTGNPRVFRVEGADIEVVASDDLAHPPNGITWSGALQAFVLAPWRGGRTLQAYRPEDGSLLRIGEMPDGGNFDGVEEVGGRLLFASQADQTIWAWRDGKAHKLIQVPGRPADIGIDTGRNRIAVPYIALDRVDIWQLPTE